VLTSQLEAIFRQATRLVGTRDLMIASVSVEAGELLVHSPRLDGESVVRGARRRAVPLPRSVALLAIGKAALEQARVLGEVLGDRLSSGLVIVPEGMGGTVPAGCELLESTHPLPSAASERAARRAGALARGMLPDELLVTAISGGASALVEQAVDGLTLADLAETSRVLLASGAPIDAVNTIRKALSAVKGGRLVAQCRAPMLTLALSDVLGDRLDLIGSGPTVPDLAPAGTAVRVVDRLGIAPALPRAVVSRLWAEAGESRVMPIADGLVLAGPTFFADAVAHCAAAAGFEIVQPTAAPASLDVNDLVDEVAAQVRALEALRRPACTVWAREPSVAVRGSGLGGRSSHFALLVAQRLAGTAAFLACGSDGDDGNTDAAGAVVDGATWERAVAAGLDPSAALADSDSGTLLAELGCAVVTGRTGVNFSDVQILAVG
jgi:glycerate 2-kinase